MPEVITIFPEEPEEPDKRPIADRVNEILKQNIGPDDSEITLSDIAESLHVKPEILTLWLENDDEFKKGLEKFIETDKSGIFRDEEFGNRADAMVIGMLIMEMKGKHLPKR